MSLNSFLLIALCTALLAVLFFITKLRRVRGQLSIIEEALEDIKSGNPNRRVLARKSDMTKRICYAINEIAVKNQSQLIQWSCGCGRKRSLYPCRSRKSVSLKAFCGSTI